MQKRLAGDALREALRESELSNGAAGRRREEGSRSPKERPFGSIVLATEDPYLTIKDITEELRLSHETVRKWIISGRLPHVKVGKGYRVKRSDLVRMLAGDGAPKTAPDARVPGPNPMRPGAGIDSGFRR